MRPRFLDQITHFMREQRGPYLSVNLEVHHDGNISSWVDRRSHRRETVAEHRALRSREKRDRMTS